MDKHTNLKGGSIMEKVVKVNVMVEVKMGIGRVLKRAMVLRLSKGTRISYLEEIISDKLCVMEDTVTVSGIKILVPEDAIVKLGVSFLSVSKDKGYISEAYDIITITKSVSLENCLDVITEQLAPGYLINIQDIIILDLIPEAVIGTDDLIIMG